LRLHPSHPERGEREVPLLREGDVLTVYLSSEDITSLRETQVFRLKDLMNVKLISRGPPLQAEFQGFELKDVPKLQWVSAKAVELEVLKPDGSKDFGLAEPAFADLKVGEVAQLERYGFVRVDAVEPKLTAVYGHR
jgi:glutamyl/glutaminyl-tRNA synthetase